MEKQTTVIEGIFLRPSEKEAALIWEAVKAEGFSENGEGVTKLLLRLLEDRDAADAEDPSPLEGLRMHFEANPGDAAVLMQGASALFGGIKTRVAAEILKRAFKK